MSRNIGILIGAILILCTHTASATGPLVLSETSHSVTFSPENPHKDPFKALILKNTVSIPSRIIEENKSAKIETKFVEPAPVIKIRVTGICGNNKSRYAIVEFQNKEYEVTPGQIINGKLQVVSISDSRVIVYSNKNKKRLNFSLGGK